MSVDLERALSDDCPNCDSSAYSHLCTQTGHQRGLV